MKTIDMKKLYSVETSLANLEKYFGCPKIAEFYAGSAANFLLKYLGAGTQWRVHASEKDIPVVLVYLKTEKGLEYDADLSRDATFYAALKTHNATHSELTEAARAEAEWYWRANRRA